MKTRWIVLAIVIIIILGLILLIPKFKTSPENISTEDKQKFSQEFRDAHPKDVQFTVQITGEELQKMTIRDAAELWNIDQKDFLVKINERFNTNANLDTVIEEVFSSSHSSKNPREVKLIAESLV